MFQPQEGISRNRQSSNSIPSQLISLIRQNWTETFIAWSPLGTYLTTFHRQGVQIWGGASWNRVERFPHRFVRLVDFSPNETYIVTWSPDPITLPPEGHPDRATILFDDSTEGHTICIWHTTTGELVPTFPPLALPEES